MGFTEKTHEYKACVQFIQAISPKPKPITASDFINFPEEGECHPAWIDKTPSKTHYVFIHHLCFDIM